PRPLPVRYTREGQKNVESCFVNHLTQQSESGVVLVCLFGWDISLGRPYNAQDFLCSRLLHGLRRNNRIFGERGHLAYAGATRGKKRGHPEELAGPPGVLGGATWGRRFGKKCCLDKTLRVR